MTVGVDGEPRGIKTNRGTPLLIGKLGIWPRIFGESVSWHIELYVICWRSYVDQTVRIDRKLLVGILSEIGNVALM